MKQLVHLSRPPELLRFLALHGALGILLGCGLAATFLLMDLANIGTLLSKSSSPFLIGFLYFSGFAVTFGSVMMASAVMFLSED